MRKITFLFTLLLGCAVSFTSFGQAKKNVIFEHFTNASCGPCASQNPVFQDNILNQNFGRIHHIAYHTSWPGTDPMNAYNPTEVQARVTYYGVTGVPNMRMQGNKYNGSPAGVTQEMVDNVASESSPIRIKVKETTIGTNRDVVVTIYTVGVEPTGVLKLRVAVVEREINYVTAPGSNGEKYFPNVFRKMLPNTTGDTYSPAATGDSVIFNYSYALDLANWDTSRIYSIAYVQNNSGKEVLNSGSALDLEWELVSQDTLFKKGTIGNTTNFSTQLSNLADLSENYRIKFFSSEPVNWSSSFEYNSVNYTDSVDINMNPKTSLDIDISVQPGATPAIGEYFFSIQSLDNPEFAPQVLRFYVISGITDLIVNGSGGWGDGVQYDFEQEYRDALSYAGNTSYAATSARIMVKGFDANTLTDVNNIYANISWTFPSLADDEAISLENFMDNGGNLFISGQDIGWDIMSGDGYGTATTQSFYTNYLHASYISDGSTSNNLLTANSSDGIFGGVANSSIAGVYGAGNEFMYPDQVSPVGIGQAIFYYNSNPSVISGIRANNGTYKMVYLAVCVQMLDDNNVKN